MRSMLLVCALITGCASTQDLSKGPGLFGGGVHSQEVKPGLFRIVASTNWTPWSNYSGARSLWAGVADKVCDEGKYREFGIQESARDTGLPSMGILKYITTTRSGYALCADASTSEEEANSFLGQSHTAISPNPAVEGALCDEAAQRPSPPR